MDTRQNESVLAHPWWRQPGSAILIILFAIYCLAIFLDLPPPAGNKYRQDIPVSVLIDWGATPNPNGLSAAHWWYKTQALRGWSMNPEGWAWPKLVPALYCTGWQFWRWEYSEPPRFIGSSGEGRNARATELCLPWLLSLYSRM